MRRITFFVQGIPATAGSKSGFVNKHSGKVIMVDSCKRGPDWRRAVQYACIEATGQSVPFPDGPVSLNIIFRLPRPKAHYGTGKKANTLKPTAPAYHTSKPDATKMTRAVEDAITGLAWRDDSQVAVQHIIKMYADDTPQVGAVITIIGDGFEHDAV